MVRKGQGWHGEPRRHGLARKGVRTVLPDGRRLAVNKFISSGEMVYGVSPDVEKRYWRAMGIMDLPDFSGELGEDVAGRDMFKRRDEVVVPLLKQEEKPVEKQEEIPVVETKEKPVDVEELKKKKKELKSREKEIKSKVRKEQLDNLKKTARKTVDIGKKTTGHILDMIRYGLSTDRSEAIQKVVGGHSKKTQEMIRDIPPDERPMQRADVTFDDVVNYKAGETVDVDVILGLMDNKSRLIELASMLEKDTEEIRIFRESIKIKNEADTNKVRADYYALEDKTNTKLKNLHKGIFGAGMLSGWDVDESEKQQYKVKKAEYERDLAIARAEAKKQIAQNEYDVQWINKRYKAFDDMSKKLWKKANAV